jgi:DNA-binding transcriptional LysR family regulator
MDLRGLEVLCHLVELRSFSKAAEAVTLSQPTVSGHIKALEEEVGVRLFDRVGRGAVPTKAGELLYGYAKRILALRAEAAQALDQYQGTLGGQLVLGGSNIPGEYILPPLLARFKAAHPEVSILLKIGDSREIVEGVAGGALELGAVGAKFDDHGLEYVRFADDELVLAFRPDHRWAARRRVRSAELAAEPIISREQGSGSRRTVERALAAGGVSPKALRIVAEMGSTEAVRQAVKAGAGVTIISRRAVAEDVRLGTLAVAGIAGLRMTRDFYLVTHRHRSKSPVCRAFLEFVLHEAARPRRREAPEAEGRTGLRPGTR